MRCGMWLPRSWAKAPHANSACGAPGALLAEIRKNFSYVEGEGDEVGARWWRERWHFAAVDGIVEGVAFDGDAACGADEAFEVGARCEFGSSGSSVVVNLFFDHCAVEVVGSEAQRDLRDGGREHDPVGLDVREIIEQQA